MALIANGTQYAASPMRTSGAALRDSCQRSAWLTPSGMRGFDSIIQREDRECGTVDLGQSVIEVGTAIATGTEIVFSSTGTLPDPLVAGTIYYAINGLELGESSTEIAIAETQLDALGAGNLGLVDVGTGTHTVTLYRSPAVRAGRPNGYEPSGAWLLPRVGGGLSAYTTMGATGDLSASMMAARQMSASMVSDGSLVTPSMSLIVSMVCEMISTGDFAGALSAVSNLSANLVSAGGVEGALGILAFCAANMVSPGGLETSNLTGIASMVAEMTTQGEIGETLTTANVGLAVWNYLLNAGYTADQLLSMMVNAGELVWDYDFQLTPTVTHSAKESLLAAESHPTASDIATELYDIQEVETGISVREMYRIVASAVAGKSNGFSATYPATIHYRNLSDTKNRITATVDEFGNRSVITLDVT